MTGLPGHGKTLYCIKMVRERAEKEKRTVYYHGIKELTLPWLEMPNPESWPDCPDGSIVVIDECQKSYRMRSLGSTPPRHVTELETHRHRGLDIYFITQHPMLLDTSLRRLVDEHYHVKRPFGMQRTTIHKSFGLMEKPDQERKDTVKTQYQFNKDDFAVYKSAEIHTVRRSIPMRVLILPLVIILAIGLGVYVYQMLKNKVGKKESVETASTLVPGQEENQKITYDYITARLPRIKGLPHTAPIYDQVMTPVVAPVPKACIKSKYKCKCYTGQGTLIDTTDQLCDEIVAHGYFDPTKKPDENKNVKQENEKRPGNQNQPNRLDDINNLQSPSSNDPKPWLS